MKRINTLIIIIIFIMCIFGLVLLIISNKDIENEKKLEYIEEGEYTSSINTNIAELREIKEYYIVEEIANYYIAEIIEKNVEELYNKLDPKYINEFNITKENIYNKVNFIENYEDINYKYYKYLIDKVYYSNYKDIATYFVYGKIINKNTGKILNMNFIVELQRSTDLYYILPNEYVENEGLENIKVGSEYKTHLLENIKNTGSNLANYGIEVDIHQFLIDHMSKFIDKIIYDEEDSYNLFSTEYKETKFNTLEKYKEYINQNIKSIISSSIKRYDIKEYEDYTEYTCIDQYGNYYIFDEKGVMDYTVKLDTYTVETEETIAEYNKKSNEDKIKANLNKVAQAINRKDYEYLYSKLDEGLRTSSFSSYEEFKNYINNNFYVVNKFSYSDSDVQGTKGVIEMQIADGTGENDNIIEKNFIVTLGEGTNYTLSFNI